MDECPQEADFGEKIKITGSGSRHRIYRHSSFWGLSVITDVEKSQNAGAGMGAQYGSDIAGQNIFDAVFAFQNGAQHGSILRTVTVGDGDYIILLRGSVFREFSGKHPNGIFPSADFAVTDQSALFRDLDDGLDIQHGAHQGAGATDGRIEESGGNICPARFLAGP